MNPKKLGLIPVKPEYDWEQADDFSWDGAFKGTPKDLLPAVKHFFRAKSKPKEFLGGSGYTLKNNIWTTIELRPSRKIPNSTIVTVAVYSKGKKLLEEARQAFLKIGVAVSEPKPFNEWEICGALSPVSQSQWNKAVRPLFDDGWNALMVHGVQHVQRGPVSIDYVPTSNKHVSIVLYR